MRDIIKAIQAKCREVGLTVPPEEMLEHVPETVLLTVMQKESYTEFAKAVSLALIYALQRQKGMKTESPESAILGKRDWSSLDAAIARSETKTVFMHGDRLRATRVTKMQAGNLEYGVFLRYLLPSEFPQIAHGRNIHLVDCLMAFGVDPDGEVIIFAMNSADFKEIE